MDSSTLDSGNQAPGWIALERKGGTWSVQIPFFWQNFPKALCAAPDGTLEIGFFPSKFGREGHAFNLLSGEHKTHELWLQLKNVDHTIIIFIRSSLDDIEQPIFSIKVSCPYNVTFGGFVIKARVEQGVIQRHNGIWLGLP